VRAQRPLKRLMADAPALSTPTLTTEHHLKPTDRGLLHSFRLRIIASSALSTCANCGRSKETAMSWDFDPRDYADPRDRENFDIYDERWFDDPRDLDDRERDFRVSVTRGPRPA
jgi:hypothetical protein